MGHKFERYCKNYENIENYDKAKKDNFKGWECHHRLETHTSDGERRLVDITKKELIALGMYYNRPAEELIFLTIKEHHAFKIGENNPMYGKKHSEETRRKMREAHLGQIPWNKGEHTGPKSDETRRRMSESHKGKNIWSKGTYFFNNGKINIRAKECPDGFTPGQLRK